jgi:hypothetical protein
VAAKDGFDTPAPVAVNVEPLNPEVEPLSPEDAADVLGPTGLAALGVSNVWLPDRGASIDCGTNEVELRPVVVPPVSDTPVCAPVEDPPTALLDALPIVAADPVRGGDELDALDADPLRPVPRTEDGAVRLCEAVEPGLGEGMPCVSAELVDRPVPLRVRFLAFGSHGTDNPFRLLGVGSGWLGWPALPVWPALLV